MPNWKKKINDPICQMDNHFGFYYFLMWSFLTSHETIFQLCAAVYLLCEAKYTRVPCQNVKVNATINQIHPFMWDTFCLLSKTPVKLAEF